jgi:hypothetical protein
MLDALKNMSLNANFLNRSASQSNDPVITIYIETANELLQTAKQLTLDIQPNTERVQLMRTTMLELMEDIPSTPPQSSSEGTSAQSAASVPAQAENVQVQQKGGGQSGGSSAEGAASVQVQPEGGGPAAEAAGGESQQSSQLVQQLAVPNGDSVSQENPPSATVSVNNNAQPFMDRAAQTIDVVLQTKQPSFRSRFGFDFSQFDREDEKEDAVGIATTESTRQNELASNETATLQYNPNFTEVMDASFMRLATDASRGNLGSGTTADMQSADLWGNQFTQPAADIAVEPERFLTTGPSGVTVETSTAEDKSENIYSFLPFAKLGGDLVWIPRHVKAARLFFTSDDYAELVSHIRDGDPLTLDKTEEVDTLVMMSTIIRTYGTLKQFCELGPMLPSTASVEQVYAEWLEMRQIGTAVARYEQITGGMYENAELSMKGGIRAAVASALRPFIEAWNRIHKDTKDQISMESDMLRPGSAPMSGGKRKAEAGIIEPEEYNPQFSFQPQELKRVKFSIPTI